MNYDGVKGLKEAFDDPEAPVSTIYTMKYAEKFSNLRKNFKGGKAVFTAPVPPIKCLGAAQKIVYLSEEAFRKNGVRNKTDVHYHIGMGAIFPVKDYAERLVEIAKSKNINVHYNENLVEVKPSERIAVFENLTTKEKSQSQFDLLHVVPPQRPPEFLRKAKGGLVDANGYVVVNQETCRHTKYPNIWSIGDCSSIPTSKTIAAITGQLPVMTTNLGRVLANPNEPNLMKYDGYTSCPIFVGDNKLMLAEFLFGLVRKETFPFDQRTPRGIFFNLKKHILPFAYWQLFSRGMWYGRRGCIRPQSLY